MFLDGATPVQCHCSSLVESAFNPFVDLSANFNPSEDLAPFGGRSDIVYRSHGPTPPAPVGDSERRAIKIE